MLSGGATSSWSTLGLPVDPLLGCSSSGANLPQLPLPLGHQATVVARTAAPAVVVIEGIPPISVKTVEKIRRWEFVDLANLLISQDPRDDTFLFVNNEVYEHKTISRSHGKSPVINNIVMWLTAYARFMAVILSAENTSKEEAAGLAAHQHVVLQLHNDLGGNRWMRYDTEFREWAAAKGIHVWGELNLAIYGRCLPQAQPTQVPCLPDVATQGFNKKDTPICFQWNKGHCTRPLCAYVHACQNCRGPHMKLDCPGRHKRARK